MDSVPLFTADTAELIRSLGIGPAHVVGMSMGGMIAFQLAVSAPDLVKSMVSLRVSGSEMPLAQAGTRRVAPNVRRTVGRE
ncbi:MAG: alpha/beta fold hydrolase [Anaerolineae bacterium]